MTPLRTRSVKRPLVLVPEDLAAVEETPLAARDLLDGCTRRRAPTGPSDCPGAGLSR
jgi:hypothetical protein